MKKSFSAAIALFIFLTFFSCSKKEILFIYDQYYPHLFSEQDSWQKDIKKAASDLGFSVEFRQMDISGSLPEIDLFIEKSSARFIMTTALYSSRIRNQIQSNEFDKVFLDLDTTGNSINASHIILPLSRDEIYEQAGILTGKKSNELQSDAAGIFLTSTPARKNEMNSFISGYSGVSDFHLVLKNTGKNDTSDLDLSDISGSVRLCFISAGASTAKTAMETVTNTLVAGEYIDSISESRGNCLFSIEYDPLFHFRQLLELSSQPDLTGNSDISADYYRIITY